MAEQIGYQDGIEAFFDWYRDEPGVPQRGPGYDPNDMSTWPWVDKLERTLRILKDDHDAAIAGNPPLPPETPAATYVKVAPITVREEGGSDQRVCLWNPDGSLRPGCFRLPNGQYGDESGALYRSDGDGLEDSSIRTKVHDPALVGARSMDNRSVCECPTVGSPEDNSGSWTV